MFLAVIVPLRSVLPTFVDAGARPDIVIVACQGFDFVAQLWVKLGRRCVLGLRIVFGRIHSAKDALRAAILGWQEQSVKERGSPLVAIVHTPIPIRFPSPPGCFTLKSLKPNLQSWIERLRAGDARALARAISTVENRGTESAELLKALFPHSGRARMIGLTGAPGAGKSTLVDQLAKHYRRAGKTLGIIAVDPTSPYTGGAILGDRIRMQDHHADPGIYIRSMATRGSLGGLARTTADVATVLDASGRDLVLIETVGVGQDEVDIVRLADITVVMLVPGMGDDVQTIKAGIMEIADIFVINKSDHPGAERVEREIRAMQSLAIRHDGWTPPIVKTVASEGKGVQELAVAIADYEAYLRNENLLLRRNIQNWRE